MLFSIFFGLCLNKFIGLNFSYLHFVIIAISSLVPDIDLKKSKIGKLFKPFSSMINLFFSHRGFFHSLIFMFLCYFILFAFFRDFSNPFLIGFSSHIILDALTVEGIRPFYPFKFKVRGFLKTGGIVEIILSFLLIGLIIFLV